MKLIELDDLKNQDASTESAYYVKSSDDIDIYIINDQFISPMRVATYSTDSQKLFLYSIDRYSGGVRIIDSYDRIYPDLLEEVMNRMMYLGLYRLTDDLFRFQFRSLVGMINL